MNQLPDLPNAIDGDFVTRFPPEASGYMHIGHVKALLLNYLYAKKYNGKCILRFDDTNPDKENVAYEEAIKEDIQTLGLVCDTTTYTSDYFNMIQNYGIILINKGLAYVDETNPETIKENRLKFIASESRNHSIEYNRNMFYQMINGDNESQNWCIRAKIDYKSKNGAMRDPVIFRSKNKQHPRTKDLYKIYPTYDFACPIVDSIERVTHTLRSVEYSDRDEQYNWFLDKLNLRHGPNNEYPIIKEYGKLNFSHTVMSKRKLSKLVDNKLVTGWDDGRMPTVRGIMRRGMQPKPLLDYIQSQGFSVNTVNLEQDKLWNLNSKYIANVPRVFGLKISNLIECTIIPKSGILPKTIAVPINPKNPMDGYRNMVMNSKVYVEREDFENQSVKEGSRYTLIGLGNCVVAEINLQNNLLVLIYDANDMDYKNTTKITWLSTSDVQKATVITYGTLLNKSKLSDNDNIIECFNHNSKIEDEYYIENTKLNKNYVIQVMRKWFCRVDSIEPLCLITIPQK